MRGGHRACALTRAEAVAAKAVLRRREGLERVRRSTVGVGVELFVHLLVRADHFARVAFDPEIEDDSNKVYFFLQG